MMKEIFLFMGMIRKHMIGVIWMVMLMAWLGVVCIDTAGLPSYIQEGQWKYLYCLGMCIPFVFFLIIFLCDESWRSFVKVVIWSLSLWGAIEAVWGLRQVYGFTYSNHSLFALTGSFYNPGPYSGYLAMVLPVCLFEWLWRWRLEKKKTVFYYAALFMTLLIVCVLPAGMSRSAWIAAVVSSVYIVIMYYRGKIRWYVASHQKRVWICFIALAVLGGIALGGIYHMKKDSADGRLFMWKIAARAIAERPWTGYGWDAVPSVYGEAQEAYFAAGQYTETEERVAGTPEYVFNEYLQVAMAWGIPVLCVCLLVIGGAVYFSLRGAEYGVSGALVSLSVFAFFSYPLQFPAFMAALVALILAAYIDVLTYYVRRSFVYVFLGCVTLISCLSSEYYDRSEQRLAACQEWVTIRMLYHSGAYEQAAKAYSLIHGDMKWNARFLFEYGHTLNKLYSAVDSNNILEEALKVSGDPMILNVMAKNERMMGHYEAAEALLLRSTHRLPGRIYPYYLLTKLYAIPDFYQPEKLKQAARVVLTKEPKVQSTAIKEMRQEVKKIIEKR